MVRGVPRPCEDQEVVVEVGESGAFDGRFGQHHLPVGSAERPEIHPPIRHRWQVDLGDVPDGVPARPLLGVPENPGQVGGVEAVFMTPSHHSLVGILVEGKGRPTGSPDPGVRPSADRDMMAPGMLAIGVCFRKLRLAGSWANAFPSKANARR